VIFIAYCFLVDCAADQPLCVDAMRFIRFTEMDAMIPILNFLRALNLRIVSYLREFHKDKKSCKKKVTKLQKKKHSQIGVGLGKR
jgi:hypothetical protein